VDTVADLRQQHRRAVVRSHLTTDLVERAALQAAANELYDQIYDSGQGAVDDNGLEYGLEEDLDDDDDDEFSGGVIVLMVEGDQEAQYADGDSVPLHCTILFAGDTAEFADGEGSDLFQTAEHIGQTIPPFSADPVSAAQFGDEDVCLIESPILVQVRTIALATPRLAAKAEANEHPLWLPHVTGLDPDAGPVRFDRVAAMVGDERHEFPLEGAPITDSPDT
jgi:hypothetical protein